MRAGIVLGLLLPIALLATACAASSLADDTGARSHDGLYQVRNTGSTSVWARSDIDLTAYDKLLAELGDVRFDPTIGNRGPGEAFPIDARTRQRVESAAAAAFREALAHVDGFLLAASPGPGVLIVRGTLLNVAPVMAPGRKPLGELSIEALEEATLVIELVDSKSRAVLLRAAETRRAEALEDLEDPTRAAAGNATPQLERMLQARGQTLKEALERLHDRFTITGDAP